MRRKKIYRLVTGLLTALFLALGVLFFRKSYLRLFESVSDLEDSLKYYLGRLLGKTWGSPSVNKESEVFKFDALPGTAAEFSGRARRYLLLLTSPENFRSWWKSALRFSVASGRAVLIALPSLLMLAALLYRLYRKGNTRHNADTVFLRGFKKLVCWFSPAKKAVCEFWGFLREEKIVRMGWGILWAVQLNLFSIAVSAAAYYLWFVVSYDISTLYLQLKKLVADLQVLFRAFPKGGLIALAWLAFDGWRKKAALNRLRHFEARNCGFINELPIVSMACGSMGKKKTTLITDMVLSQEVMFRQKALKILQENDLKFPCFPWICFEKELRACIGHKTVYNLASVKTWVALKRKRFETHQDAKRQLYGYDCERYGMTFRDGINESDLFDVLETYALAYFVYVVESSLIVANYSVRTDNALLDGGNFPLWLSDFFGGERESRYAHILDFDVLRLGKKVLENNPRAGSFEFGVVAITEVGKERGNNLELKEVKKGTAETNQKNDLFNSWLKMCRHSATIDGFPFVKVFTDEQRPESWGADARDLAEVITVLSSGEQRLALPFYTIGEMISEWATEGFLNLYMDFRFRRGDNTLAVYLLKSVAAWLWRRNLRMKNRFGYSVLKIEKERGTLDGKPEKKKYFLMNAKIYARRFSTDCFSDYFNDLAKKSKTGLSDYPEYRTVKASVGELREQNSYFINTLYGQGEEEK